MIAFIFIFNAFKNLAHIGTHNKFAPATLAVVGCQCVPNNTETEDIQVDVKWKNVTTEECSSLNGTMASRIILNIFYIQTFITLNKRVSDRN